MVTLSALRSPLGFLKIILIVSTIVHYHCIEQLTIIEVITYSMIIILIILYTIV